MAKAKAPKVPLGILIREEQDNSFGGGYYHLRGSIVTLVNGKVRNPPSSSYDEPINGFGRLADLELNSQGERTNAQRGLYGFDVRYRNVSFIEARDAQRMHQTLTRLNNGMSKLYAKRGMVQSFGEYVGRVAEVLGIETIVFDYTPEGSHSWSHDERDYRHRSIGDGVNEVNHKVWQWQEKHKAPEQANA